MPSTKDFLKNEDDAELGKTWQEQTKPADKGEETEPTLKKTGLMDLPEGSGKGGNVWKWQRVQMRIDFDISQRDLRSILNEYDKKYEVAYRKIFNNLNKDSKNYFSSLVDFNEEHADLVKSFADDLYALIFRIYDKPYTYNYK